jgi:hypothetical protein
MKLLIISSASRGFKLTDTPGTPLARPIESVAVPTKIQGEPMAFVALPIGALSRDVGSGRS